MSAPGNGHALIAVSPMSRTITMRNESRLRQVLVERRARGHAGFLQLDDHQSRLESGLANPTKSGRQGVTA